MTVKIVCSWCGKVIREEGEKEGWRIEQVVNEGKPSHGICPECVEEHFGPEMAKIIEARTFDIEMIEQSKCK